MYIYNLATGVWNIQVSVNASSSGAPGARNLHTATCLKDKMIIYGGGTTAPFDSDVWVLDVSKYPTLTWQRIDMQNKDQSPSARMGHSAALDESGQKVYIFGGWGGSATGDNHMYILDTTAWSWTKVAPSGLPSAANPSSAPSNTPSGSNVGAIAGGVVGGVIGVALIGALAFFFLRRRKRNQEQYNRGLEKRDDAEYYDNYSQYWIDGDGSQYDMNEPSMIPPPTSPFPPNKRISKALEPGINYRDSIRTYGMRSELGDTDRVMTGVLEEVDIASTAATNYTNNNSRDYRGSRHNSKVLLVPDSELRNGLSPEEIISQKPNEFSMPASQLAVAHGGHIPVDHYTQSPTSITATLGLPLTAGGIGSADNSQKSYDRDGSNTQGGSTQDGSVPPLDSETLKEQQAALAPLLNMLPRRYKVEKNLQPIQGPMNSIIFVNKAENNQPVVIKWFGRREAWERECRTLIRLKSGHVVELLEVLTIQDESSQAAATSSTSNDEDEGEHVKYVTVMERLDETLATAVRAARSNSWSQAYTREIAKNVVECLVLCHSRGVAFCDLKPSNIMHSGNGPWKLIDFEASRTIGEECVGVITPRYCPPEVARATTYGLEGANGVVATPGVDLWALGCVIYELETKHALFATNIKDETILHFVSHPSPSTPILNNGLRWNEQKELYIPNLERTIPDPTTRELIQILLSRDPAKRGTASELLNHPYFLHEQ
ncbi:kinase-like domain-containing protein [Dichotomocladium elegans]|nr:kinase-like domain-containing protein [Dichotomocladium elegans]